MYSTLPGTSGPSRGLRPDEAQAMADAIEALKAHPFFEGIDFHYQLIDMKVKELLEASEPKSSI
jgi:hypothetical protein